MDAGSPRARRWRAYLDTRLGPLRAWARGELSLDASWCEAECRALWMFTCVRGHRQNLYDRTGVPRTHSAWEMQMIVDDGLLFAIHDHCAAFVFDGDEGAVSRLATLLAGPDTAQLRARTRAYYAGAIEPWVARGPWDRRRPALGGAHGAYFDRVIIEAYLRLAVSTPAAVLTLDLFPANTGTDNVAEGLKGLVRARWTADGLAGARRFWSIRAESYTRYYGYNLAKLLARSPEGPRFGLVVPHANGVRHIALTRCWPIDGAENIARYVELAQARHRSLARSPSPAPRILVSGYSQGGAAVRLFDDALAGVDVVGREYFRESVPRGYVRRCRALAELDALARRWPLEVYTASVATMGGIDGIGLHERFPELDGLSADQRGAAGVRAHANGLGGVHLAICHDLDPARWIVPGPLPKLRRRLSPAQRRKLDLVRTLLKFGGPAKALHGGVWTTGADHAFARNPPARALFEEIEAKLISPRFVDEHRYVDDRCRRAAFAHLVVGALGYPGWVVVDKLRASLAERDARLAAGAPEPGELLLAEPSWACDILPAELVFDEVVGRARAFHEAQHQRALAFIDALERELEDGGEQLLETLRARFGVPFERIHLLDGREP